ncbi:hypothetical protein ACTA71_004162 [Dictyostelium dimigraforme]
MTFKLEKHFKSNGLLLVGNYKFRIRNFIENGGTLKELVKNEISIQTNRKISMLSSEFKKYGIQKQNLRFPEKYSEYIHTFTNKKNVWSKEKIIKEELIWLNSQKLEIF